MDLFEDSLIDRLISLDPGAHDSLLVSLLCGEELFVFVDEDLHVYFLNRVFYLQFSVVLLLLLLIEEIPVLLRNSLSAHVLLHQLLEPSLLQVFEPNEVALQGLDLSHRQQVFSLHHDLVHHSWSDQRHELLQFLEVTMGGISHQVLSWLHVDVVFAVDPSSQIDVYGPRRQNVFVHSVDSFGQVNESLFGFVSEVFQVIPHFVDHVISLGVQNDFRVVFFGQIETQFLLSNRVTVDEDLEVLFS